MGRSRPPNLSRGLDGLAKLVRTDSLDEKSKALALSHYNALGIFKESGEVPWFILAFYGSKNVSIEENGKAQRSVHIEKPPPLRSHQRHNGISIGHAPKRDVRLPLGSSTAAPVLGSATVLSFFLCLPIDDPTK